MRLPPFAYARASTVDEALDLLREGGDEAKLLAGGQSLVPVLAYRLFRPSHSSTSTASPASTASPSRTASSRSALPSGMRGWSGPGCTARMS